MKKTLVITTAAFMLIAGTLMISGLAHQPVIAQETISGDWAGKVRETTRGRVLWLSLNRSETDRNRFQMSLELPLGDFTGLNTDAGANAQFSLRREAGEVTFVGLFRNGNGVGEFRFTPQSSFAGAMRNLGYEDELTTQKLFTMTIHDVGTGFINELRSLGYERVPLNKLIAMRIHDADGDFIRRMRALGYDNISTDKLVAMRIHGVDEQFIREAEAMGFPKLPIDKLVTMRIHGVNREFVEGVKTLGYTNLSLDKLVSMRIHGVNAEFVKEMEGAGYGRISLDKLISMRIHGVNGQFAKEMRDAGYPNLSVDDLIQLRIHGVDGNYVKKMKGNR
jgi:hypothetical protein